MEITNLVREVERLHVAPDEVLVVRPKRIMSRAELEQLHRNLGRLATALGWGPERIVVLDRDVEMTAVKAEQMQLGGDQ